MCAISSNIGAGPFGSSMKSGTDSKVIIFADVNGVWPNCQNYFIVTDDRTLFYENYDTSVMDYIKQMQGDPLANPIQYLGCPNA